MRTMFSVGKTAQITAKMNRYGIGILRISECRWSGFGRLKTRTGETIIYSGRDDDVHQSGVAIIMSKKVAQCLDSWRQVKGDWNAKVGEQQLGEKGILGKFGMAR